MEFKSSKVIEANEENDEDTVIEFALKAETPAPVRMTKAKIRREIEYERDNKESSKAVIESEKKNIAAIDKRITLLKNSIK